MQQTGWRKLDEANLMKQTWWNQLDETNLMEQASWNVSDDTNLMNITGWKQTQLKQTGWNKLLKSVLWNKLGETDLIKQTWWNTLDETNLMKHTWVSCFCEICCVSQRSVVCSQRSVALLETKLCFWAEMITLSSCDDFVQHLLTFVSIVWLLSAD